MEGDDGVTDEADTIYDERDIDDDRLDMVDCGQALLQRSTYADGANTLTNRRGFKKERRFRPADDGSASFVVDNDSRRREEGLLPSEEPELTEFFREVDVFAWP